MYAIFPRRILNDMGHNENDPTSLFCDNSSAIKLCNYNVFRRKIKHIDTHCHFIRELVNNGKNYLQFCGSKKRLVDISPNHCEQLHLNIRESA